jgi:dUTP pyrophosphatase
MNLTYATSGSAAADLHADVARVKGTREGPRFLMQHREHPERDTMDMQPGDRLKVPTGVMAKDVFDRLPKSDNYEYALQVLPRSGLSWNGLCIVNSPGLIDPDYEGEILVALEHVGYEDGPGIVINQGDRIAQLIAVPFIRIPGVPAGTGVRGNGGFGSTGTESTTTK